MTSAQHRAKPSGTWLALFNEQLATLTAVAEMLLPSRVANIDQVHKFAKRRIRYSSNASSQLPDVSGSSQRLDRIAAWR
jgi:hypothetical protein